MNDFTKKLIRCLSGTPEPYDFNTNSKVVEEIRNFYKKKNRKAKIECSLRLAAAIAITIYGVIGIKYNTGLHVTWALFTAIVGVNAAMVIILWYWQIQAKLSILKEMKELQLQLTELTQKQNNHEN